VEVNVRLLRCLVAVVDEGHFGRAAERLYISGPSLSQQIRKLESQVKLTLLDRRTHPVRPTPEAVEFVEAARSLLADADRVAAIALAAGRLGANRLNLGFVMTFAGRLTRPILDTFAAARPEITVDLVELGFDEQVRSVLRGAVDASFVVGPVDRDPRLELDEVLTERRTLAVSTANPLAARGSVAIGEVGGELLIGLDPETVGRRWARWWSVDPRPDGSRPRHGPRCHSAVDFLELIDTGRGVGITAESYGALFPRPGIAYVPIDDIEHSTTYLCTRAGDRSPIVAQLRQVTREIASRERPGLSSRR
jgi:DNA-binding transcriptional LysR family regulator